MNFGKPVNFMNTGKPLSNYGVLIVISYYAGDRAMCRKMIDLMVDLEPVHVKRRAGVLLVHRQDVVKPDKGMVEKLKERFDVQTLRAPSPLVGWPAGCNGMFGTAMQHIRSWKLPCECVLWMESDCTPMHPGWFDDLAKDWEKKKPFTLIKGWMGDCNGDGTGWHITGCALYHPDIAYRLPEIASCSTVAWDYCCRRQMLAVGERSELIDLAYKAKAGTPEMMEKGYAMVHGVKDGSLCDMVREKYLRGVGSSR